MVAVSFQSLLAQLVHTSICAVCMSGNYLTRRFRDLRISVGAGEKEQVFVAAQICNSEFQLS